MKKSIVIGTRGSKLALWQTDFIATKLKKKYPSLAIEQRRITTKGDKILDAPLAKIGGKGLFTKEIETALTDGEIDIAVHSMKDMPTEIPAGLALAAVTERETPFDALIAKNGETLDTLPKNARIGTSSLRRKAQLLHARSDFIVADLRGNVDTRIKKLDAGEFDAIILAAAGLTRLGFAERITETIAPQKMLPAAGQGALAIETREDDEETRTLISFLNDETAALCASAERAFLATAGGGCQAPMGIYARPDENSADEIIVDAFIASPDGKKIYRADLRGEKKDAAAIGKTLAEKLLDAGARDVLAALGIAVNR